MAWTSPKTWSVAEKVTAALMNLHLRDNLNYLKGLLDGTGADNVIVPAALVIDDSNYFLSMSSPTVPRITFDSGTDLLQYDRTANEYVFYVGGAAVIRFDAAGKLAGTGFYDSGEVSVSAGATQGFLHGLGVQPRFIGVYFGTAGSTTNVATPAFISVGATVRYSANSSTTISVTNNHGSAWTVRVFAMK